MVPHHFIFDQNRQQNRTSRRQSIWWNVGGEFFIDISWSMQWKHKPPHIFFFVALWLQQIKDNQVENSGVISLSKSLKVNTTLTELFLDGQKKKNKRNILERQHAMCFQTTNCIIQMRHLGMVVQQHSVNLWKSIQHLLHFMWTVCIMWDVDKLWYLFEMNTNFQTILLEILEQLHWVTRWRLTQHWQNYF